METGDEGGGGTALVAISIWEKLSYYFFLFSINLFVHFIIPSMFTK